MSPGRPYRTRRGDTVGVEVPVTLRLNRSLGSRYGEGFLRKGSGLSQPQDDILEYRNTWKTRVVRTPTVMCLRVLFQTVTVVGLTMSDLTQGSLSI